MLAVFDFPAKEGPADHVPLLAVDYVTCDTASTLLPSGSSAKAP